MDPLRIAVRALVAYAYLLVLTRVSGKRVVNQATPFDFVVALIIGDLVDDCIWAEVSVPKFGAAAGSIVFCELIATTLAYRWRASFRLLDGDPTVLLRDGHEDGHELRREQMSESDLAGLLRIEGIEEWKDVHLATAERDHELSVILAPGAEPVQRRDADRVKELLQE